MLGFFQPVVPISVWVGLAGLLLDADGDLRPPGPVALVATLLVPLVPNAVLVGLGVVALGRTSLHDLGWKLPDKPAREAALGLCGLVAYLAVFALAVGSLADEPHSTLATALSYPASSRLLLLVAGAHIAFFEESVFRGYLQPALIGKLG